MMRWSRGSAELPSDKTFLVIRQHSQSSPDSGKEASASSSCCETWPKMRRRHARESRPPSADEGEGCGPGEDQPRPATASLEAPLVLDPRLVDKLDMSLLSKESLTDSLTRISARLARSPLDDPAAKAGRASKSFGGSPTSNRVQLVRPRVRLAAREAPAAYSEADSRTTSSATVVGFRASNSSPEVKKLDDNNNKNRERSSGNCGHPATQLSPMRSRSSRNRANSSDVQLSPVHCRSSRHAVNSSDVALFTAGQTPGSKTKKSVLPVEPCQACGRAAQPERFHSHPKSPADSPGHKSSSPSYRIPTMLEVLQRQLPGSVLDRRAASAASDRQLSATSTSTEEKTPSEQEADFARKDKNVNWKANMPKEDKSAVSLGKRRPRTVTCYICGREFGTASFPIHEPKCLQKWQRENKALPSSQRRSVPQRPNVPIDHEDWNVVAWEHSQALLIPCSKCKRTFLPDRLAIHERNCRTSNKGGICNSNYSRALALSRSELQRMDISNYLSGRSKEAVDDQRSVGQMSARVKSSRIAVRMDAARKIA